MTVHFLSLADDQVEVDLPGMSACDCPPELGLIRTNVAVQHGDLICITDLMEIGSKRVWRVERIDDGSAIVSQGLVRTARRIDRDYLDLSLYHDVEFFGDDR